MIDLTQETPVTFAAAPQFVPAIMVSGTEARKKLHQRTIYNWATKGKRGVILESAPIGGILVTTREALQRFFERLTAARDQRRFDAREPEQRRRGRQPRQRDNQGERRELTHKHGV